MQQLYIVELFHIQREMKSNFCAAHFQFATTVLCTKFYKIPNEKRKYEIIASKLAADVNHSQNHYTFTPSRQVNKYMNYESQFDK